MIRVVLVGLDEADWRTYRQEQWMAEVRRDPSVAARPRIHFDVEESAYREALASWASSGPGASRESAVDRLVRAGAVEVGPR